MTGTDYKILKGVLKREMGGKKCISRGNKFQSLEPITEKDLSTLRDEWEWGEKKGTLNLS